jgi:Zn-dependent peptidase ImmA (M78 family)
VRQIAEADNAAQYLREHWNLGIDPIHNLVELLEEHGIKVLVVLSEEDIDGLAARVRRSRGEPAPIILIRHGVHGERQRFNLARELGHMVMELKGEERSREKAAHRFAGAFLMPTEAVWSNVGGHRSSIGWSELFALKKLFGASVQAITCRCADLGIFPQSLARRLFREFSRLGYRTAPKYEPNPLPEEEPGRFEHLCYRALAEGAISEPKTAELLNIAVRELNRRMGKPAAAGRQYPFD